MRLKMNKVFGLIACFSITSLFAQQGQYQYPPQQQYPPQGQYQQYPPPPQQYPPQQYPPQGQYQYPPQQQPVVPQQVVPVPQQPLAPPPPPPAVAEPEVKPERKKGALLGAHAQIVWNNFSSGESNFDKNVDMGMGFGIGGVSRFQIADAYYIRTEVAILYRSLFDYSNSGYSYSISEFALNFPIMFQFVPAPKIPLYLGAGLQVDLPFGAEGKASGGGVSKTEDYDHRSVLDAGIVIGAEYIILSNWSADFKAVIGLTTPSTADDMNKSSFHQFALGVNYFFL